MVLSFPKSSNLSNNLPAVCKQFTNSRCTDRSNKGCSHHSNTSPNQRLQKKSCNPSQLSLLSQQIGASIEPVLQHLSLAPDRFYIWLTIDFERWAIPVQLTRSEALRLLPLLAEERDQGEALRSVERVLPPTMESAE